MTRTDDRAPDHRRNGEQNATPALPFLETRYGHRRPQRTTAKSSESVLGQLRTAFTGHPLAFLVALPFGGFVPIAVWCLTHPEAVDSWDCVLIAGGALFSSLTVIEWGRTVLRNLPKAIGFAVLVEGVMITAETDWLSLTALALLIVINSVACAVALTRDENSG